MKALTCNLFIVIISTLTSTYTCANNIGEMTQSCSNQRPAEALNNNLNRQLDTAPKLPDEGDEKRITRISFHQLNVFDTSLPEENNALFRFANRAHITTKPEVLRSILLFKEGESYSQKRLVESERLLRNQSFLYDARVFAEEDCHGDIEVNVVTRDLWTLLPELSFSRSGGENSSRIGFRETNLLGWGKRLSLTQTKDKDRSGYLFVYDDPHILSTRYRGRIEYADNSDGKRHYIGVHYPFFSTETPYSYGISDFNNRRIESLYQAGEEVSEYEHYSKISDVYLGAAKQLENDWTQRLSIGFRNHEDTFKATNASRLPIAQNRRLTYPYIQAHWFEDNYIKVRNFDSIYRTEDLNLGWNINASIGYSDNQLSDDQDHFIYNFTVEKAHYTSKRSLWRSALALNGQWNSEQNRARNMISQASFEYYFNSSLYQSWYAKVQLRFAKNLTEDLQLTLGGETGLRGYPIKYQHGSKSVLVNLEKRYYWEYDLLQLFKVGGAVFFDIGRVRGNTLVDSDPNYLKNVGMGLRLAPSRANAGLVLHLDVAAPLNGPNNIDGVQWLFTVKNRF
ncbi:Outer membrane protein assembly factor BamA [Pseudoalteromonas holothuriae]|uniref:Outer membrane protein assembly factor BamA n=1 Tax=Pseudoalteromonas holothuriae TaxID=2963714 RepID=A0ABN8UGC3_9GAMM|nr:Outer membrane protein assembly factor BamA [Pseudoalteromonas sp. CIP111951]